MERLGIDKFTKMPDFELKSILGGNCVDSYKTYGKDFRKGRGASVEPMDDVTEEYNSAGILIERCIRYHNVEY
jgi:hypothetical protein